VIADAIEAVRVALAGDAAPVVIVIALALTTLLLEDVAIAAGVALATHGSISWGASALAVGGGIALGDVGLYGLGLAATRVGWLRARYVDTARAHWVRTRLARRLPSAVLLARVIPGLRLLTYVACGFVRVPFAPFAVWVGVGVTLWTAGLYAVSVALGDVLAQRFGVPAPVAVALPVLLLAIAVPLWRTVVRPASGGSPP
jgi:membrane protein DedA with SNARE-associated domain